VNESEMEKLVTLITEEVVKKIRQAGEGSAAAESDGAEAQLPFLEKHIITEKELKGRLSGNESEIRVAKKCIITPAALDWLKEHRVTVIRSSEEAARRTNARNVSVTLFAPQCSLKARGIYIDIVREAGFNAQLLDVSDEALSNILQKTDDIFQRVSQAKDEYAIIIEEHIFQLNSRANRLENVNGVICWDAASAAESFCQNQPNVLFVHNSLLAFKTICDILKSWIAKISN
jgi:ribose 5-phosphate isomerase RpiB